jgi:hypothetical protein
MRTRLLPPALLLGLLVVIPARAQYPPCCPAPYIPQAPDACGPGCYAVNPWSQLFGPNYNVYPGGLPWNGALPPPSPPGGGGGGGGGPAGCGFGGYFPTHPFARSPRDYFMEYEKEQEITPFSRGYR